MRHRVVVDTNVLVYATFEDSEHHKEAYAVLQENEIVVPRIVLYEYLWVLARLTGNPSLLELKMKELSDYELICEDYETVRRGVGRMLEEGASLEMLNDYIVFSVALREGALATYDKKLRKLASRSGLHIIP
jgi:predicted nucleic acid-binding protein